MELTQEMIKGTVVPVMLKLLTERAMYGYELIKVVNERTDNALQWKEGTLYPWLHRLEADGLIRGEWGEAESGRQRKYYRITRKGAVALEKSVHQWVSLSTAVNAILLAPGVA
jgi:PadR family transcriptional regulator, regulatory protein PadR